VLAMRHKLSISYRALRRRWRNVENHAPTARATLLALGYERRPVGTESGSWSSPFIRRSAALFLETREKIVSCCQWNNTPLDGGRFPYFHGKNLVKTHWKAGFSKVV
jgi:hypothetical protein